MGQWGKNGADLYYSSGKVGIGTSAPMATLEIQTGAENALRIKNKNSDQYSDKSVKIEMESGGAYSVNIKSWDIELGSFLNRHSLASGQLYFASQKYGEPDSIPRLVLTQDGNVGIGSTNPIEMLEVAGNVKAAKFIGDGTGLSGIASQWIGGGNSSANALYFAAASGSTGNVGIGTSNPQSDLHIKTSGENADILLDANGQKMWNLASHSNGNFYLAQKKTDGTFSDKLIITSQGTVGVGTDITNKIGNARAKFVVVGASSNDPANIAIAGSEISDTYDGKLHIKSGGSSIVFDGEDNVGIGVDSPGFKLDVRSAGHKALGLRNGNFENTGDKTCLLQLRAGGAYQSSRNAWNIAIGGAGNGLGLDGSQLYLEYLEAVREGDQYNDNLSGKGAKVVVTKDGSVGIGTTSPSQMLTVTGNVLANDFIPTNPNSILNTKMIIWGRHVRQDKWCKINIGTNKCIVNVYLWAKYGTGKWEKPSDSQVGEYDPETGILTVRSGSYFGYVDGDFLVAIFYLDTPPAFPELSRGDW